MATIPGLGIGPVAGISNGRELSRRPLLSLLTLRWRVDPARIGPDGLMFLQRPPTLTPVSE